MAVVVHPVRLDGRLVQGQRGGHRVTRRPLGRDAGLVDSGLPFGHQPSGPQAQRTQRSHDVDQVVVAEPLELSHGPALGLLLAAGGHHLDEVLGQVRGLQLRPRQLQGRAELAEHVAHALFTARQVEGEVGPHAGPPQARAVVHRLVQLSRGGHTVVDQVQDLPPQGLLEPVREVALDLGSNEQRVHDQVVVVGQGRIHRFGRCLATGYHLN